VSKLPTLREQRTRVLHEVLLYLVAEVESCDSGVVPRHRGAFLALAGLVDLELRCRDPRRSTHPELRKALARDGRRP